jgi:hypothetical protein
VGRIDAQQYTEHMVELVIEEKGPFTNVVLHVLDRQTGEVVQETTVWKIEGCSGDVWSKSDRHWCITGNIYGSPKWL